MKPVVDILIPTIIGREASLERCSRSYKDLAGVATNVIVIPDSETCGWGWKQGLCASRAPYVLLACDDQEAIAQDWAKVCIETVDAGFLPCPRVWKPDGGIESQGGDMSAYEHLIRRPQRDQTYVDYTTVPFLSREMAEQIGMIDTHYCSDVWVSYRGRQLGYQTMLRHGFDLRHWQEQLGRGAGMSQAERDAMDCNTLFAALAEAEESDRALTGSQAR